MTRDYAGMPNEGLVVIVGLLAAAMVVCWVGALDRLAHQHEWSWFAGVLTLQLLGLGIAGMGAYMVAGPADVDFSTAGISS